MVNDQWIDDTPVHSDVEAKLRQLLVDLGRNNKILGIQVWTIIKTECRMTIRIVSFHLCSTKQKLTAFLT